MMFDVWISNLHHHWILHHYSHFLPLHFHFHPNWKERDFSRKRSLLELFTELDQERILRHSSHQMHRNLRHHHYVSSLVAPFDLHPNQLNIRRKKSMEMLHSFIYLNLDRFHRHLHQLASLLLSIFYHNHQNDNSWFFVDMIEHRVFQVLPFRIDLVVNWTIV